MNIIHASQYVLDFTSATPSTDGRFQIYRESRGGNFSPGFGTDSDAEAIKAFMLQPPVYEGGDIRLLDQSEQRMVALVKWRIATNKIGVPVVRRVNVFHDWHFALIACDLLMQEKICAAVEMRF